jgi:hypothetical protein
VFDFKRNTRIYIDKGYFWLLFEDLLTAEEQDLIDKNMALGSSDV